MRNTENNAVLKNTLTSDKTCEISRAEAEPECILYFRCQSDGCDEFVKSEYPETVVQELDSGKYDRDLVSGMRLVSALWIGCYTECFTLMPEQHLSVWRWVVAAVFIGEMREENGLVEVQNERGETEQVAVYTGEKGGIVVYPWAERFALANHIEGLANEMFPPDQAPEMAMNIYRSMIEADPDGQGIRMSVAGRKGMALLHDGFIETLKTEGLPDAPVMH
ncbi:TPA: hypothetical protein G8L55_002206 [Salmonella enterica]|uniref:Uncharacterized protein n=1 Tax=Salmonella enterica TaxID=28901 RepID=A0A742SUA9_SALER|nr:hypothetical protein [Salmonella enterica]EBY7517550.1 hypothetical protein [Salmonella enterica subsp. enterica serovar Richmond]ECF6858468.1 hypothetical protein [Salmonella enterica subsp. arizonae]ECJ2856623.1 hypothetical protein [Salmonella enterica subsp. diarizonae]ECJ2965817.1 hypothetical protein [Salmonella enterica subsp. salamae]EDD8363968.1 hypothetical protein [Salmonella enterica subsp. enterica serovar Ball]EDE2636293.1 hypothetical protein [Salmonella enterica subsp. ente